MDLPKLGFPFLSIRSHPKPNPSSPPPHRRRRRRPKTLPLPLFSGVGGGAPVSSLLLPLSSLIPSRGCSPPPPALFACCSSFRSWQIRFLLSPIVEKNGLLNALDFFCCCWFDCRSGYGALALRLVVYRRGEDDDGDG